MEAAKRQAEIALTRGQAPYGCVIEKNGQIIAAAHNQVSQRQDAVAHAEILALQEAQAIAGTTTLSGCTLYTTAEPCPMCAGALLWAKVDRVVYGVSIQDITKAGGKQIEVNLQMLANNSPNNPEIIGGVMRDELIGLYQRYYLSHS